MNSVIVSRQPNGSYQVTDHNDEILRVLALLFLDKTSKTQICKILNSITEPKVGEIFKLHSNPHLLFDVEQYEDNRLIIKLNDKSDLYPHHYQIDIRNDSLLDLIDDWDDLVEQNTQEIILNRDAGNLYITGNL